MAAPASDARINAIAAEARTALRGGVGTAIVRGHDLDIEIPVAPWEAALGADIEVPTLEGAVRMKVPAGAKSAQKFRVAGKGLPKPGAIRGP